MFINHFNLSLPPVVREKKCPNVYHKNEYSSYLPAMIDELEICKF